MDITSPILKAHGGLSKVSLDFLEFVKKNPGSLDAENYGTLNLDTAMIRLQPWPTFVNRARVNEMREAGTAVVNLVKSIPGRIFAHNPREMSEYYGIPEDTVKRQLTGINHFHTANLLARGDFFLSPTGWKCLEFNITAKLGGLQIPFWKSLYLNTPIIASFFKEYRPAIVEKNLVSALLDHVIEAATARFPSYRSMNVAQAISGYQGDCRFMERYLDEMYKKKLRQLPGQPGGRIVMCPIDRLWVEDNRVFYGGDEICSLIEWEHGQIPEALLQAFQAGNICLYNGPITGILANKLNLALLSENMDSSAFFSSEEREIIRKYIPWTRKITGNKDFLLSHQETLVIKPSSGLGGEGVHIGRNTPEADWAQCVDRAIREKNWLVQERVESPAYLYQSGRQGCEEHYLVWGLFLFGQNFSGIDVRVLPRKNTDGVINAHQGASTSIVFEVEE